MKTNPRWLWAGIVVAVAAIGCYASVFAQQVTKVAETNKANGRFEFEVVESYDSKYLGDTPGHIGRHGELGDARPQAAIGDPVFRGEEKVGKVTNLAWSRGHGSLEITFDPEPKTRIEVGEIVWLKLGGQ